MSMVALGLVRDLFFRSKLDAVASSLDAEILYASDLENARRRAAEKKPTVVFADLSDAAFPVADTAAKIREAARHYVESSRTWPICAAVYRDVYAMARQRVLAARF